MRRLLIVAFTALAAFPSVAQAATFVIMTDPMTLERRTYMIDSRGPDRVLMCAMPPATSGCVDVTARR